MHFAVSYHSALVLVCIKQFFFGFGYHNSRMDKDCVYDINELVDSYVASYISFLSYYSCPTGIEDNLSLHIFFYIFYHGYLA